MVWVYLSFWKDLIPVLRLGAIVTCAGGSNSMTSLDRIVAFNGSRKDGVFEDKVTGAVCGANHDV